MYLSPVIFKVLIAYLLRQEILKVLACVRVFVRIVFVSPWLHSSFGVDCRAASRPSPIPPAGACLCRRQVHVAVAVTRDPVQGYSFGFEICLFQHQVTHIMTGQLLEIQHLHYSMLEGVLDATLLYSTTEQCLSAARCSPCSKASM